MKKKPSQRTAARQAAARQAAARQAAALKYDRLTNRAPQLVAKGRGKVAEKIIELAKAHQVPLIEDGNLAQLLDALDIDSEIPPELYQAVAEILVFIHRLNRLFPDMPPD